MDYILRGNDKDVTNVLKEQRIRISRGVIKLIPISECGLVTEEDAKIGEFTESITEKDKIITELTTERDSMKARIAELEAVITDNKDIPAGDSKELPVEDSKVMTETDNKSLSPVDEKKTGRKTSK